MSCPVLTLLHEFAGGAADGFFPSYGALTLSGSTLYGMTPQGGDWDRGVVLSIGTDGNGFTLLHEFAGGGYDGSGPQGDLVLSGSTLYGVTEYGGNSNRGVLFSIGTDGCDFTLLHESVGGADDGERSSAGAPVASGSAVYGMTLVGGNSNRGVAYRLR